MFNPLLPHPVTVVFTLILRYLRLSLESTFFRQDASLQDKFGCKHAVLQIHPNMTVGSLNEVDRGPYTFS
ncbi:hypothetical protein N836_19685 [Leptolyngbya sp. Heron Island J]|nr:hypothetical protein N836_19685 [Leptolyngbya sp. Heron Island J]